MFTASEFRQFANEAIEAARNASSEQRRKHHLDMAKLWTTAAALLDGDGMMPKFDDQPR
jgi:hypothetical protein